MGKLSDLNKRLQGIEQAQQQQCLALIDNELARMTREEKKSLSAKFDGCTNVNAMLAWIEAVMDRNGLGATYRALRDRLVVAR